MAIPPPQESGYQLWWYYPSIPGNAILAALFGILTVTHLLGLSIRRLTFCIPLAIGGIFECIGYVVRIIAHSSSKSVPLYAAQSLVILLAPILFAASVYMYLGRLMIATKTTHLPPIPIKWLTKIFVFGDVLCFLIQAGGGGMQASAKTASEMQLAEDIILAGLCLQILFTGIFMVVAVMVHIRMSHQSRDETTIAWRRMLVALYVVSSLICLRNVYRAIEYGLGSTGYLLTHEWPGFVFDGALMVIALGVCVSWYLGDGAKLNPRHNGQAVVKEVKDDWSRSPSP